MQVKCITVGMFQVNTYLLTDEATVDTGEDDELLRRLAALRPEPNIHLIW